jgi:cell division protein FtsX
MKRLIAVLVVLVLLFVGVGFYRGWFALSKSDADAGNNKVNVNLTVDGDKMQEDAEAVKKKAAELTENVTGREKDPDDSATNKVKSIDP